MKDLEKISKEKESILMRVTKIENLEDLEKMSKEKESILIRELEERINEIIKEIKIPGYKVRKQRKKKINKIFKK